MSIRFRSSFPRRSANYIVNRLDLFRRAMRDFLGLPSFIIFLFLLLAIGAYQFERSQIQTFSPLRELLQQRVFADAEATSELLGTIAGSIINVTSITITLMLLIVQQTASSMSSQVFDQFLRRRSNQLFFGFFIGLALYTLITLATVNAPFNPVLAAALAFLLTGIGLYLLILLFFATIHQMRPAVIIQAIHDHALKARKHQRTLLDRTRRESQHNGVISQEVRAADYGFVTHIDLDRLARMVRHAGQALEVVLEVSIGSFVAFQDRLADIKLEDMEGIEDLEDEVRKAIHLERTRDVSTDPAYGIHQLEVIAWTATSTAKSNPEPGLQAVYSLTDLFAQWADEVYHPEHDSPVEDPLPVVYNDQVIEELTGTFVSLSVVAATTHEHMILVEILRAFSLLFERLSEAWQNQVEDAIQRILPTVPSHHPTHRLEQTLQELIEVLQSAERAETAKSLQMALTLLKDSSYLLDRKTPH